MERKPGSEYAGHIPLSHLFVKKMEGGQFVFNRPIADEGSLLNDFLSGGDLDN